MHSDESIMTLDFRAKCFKMHFISNTSLSLKYPFWNSCCRHMNTNSLMSRRAQTLRLPCLPVHWTSATDKSNAAGCNADSGNFLERNWSSNPSVLGSCSSKKMKSWTEGESNCCSRRGWGDWRSLRMTWKPEEIILKAQKILIKIQHAWLYLLVQTYLSIKTVQMPKKGFIKNEKHQTHTRLVP